jgi:hypothetical protein
MFVEPKQLVALAKKLNVDGEQKRAVDALVKVYEQEVELREGDPFGIWFNFGRIRDPSAL